MRNSNRPVYIQYPSEGPTYESGPMPTVEVRMVSTVVLEDLRARIDDELNERKHIRMVLKEGHP